MNVQLERIDGIAVRSAGEGPAVLWVHGYTLDGTMWSELWPRLPGFRHVALDLPGHGDSIAMAPRTSLTSLAEMVNRVADAVGAVHLAGMSYGGSIALAALAAAPKRYARAVLASAAFPGGPVDSEAQSANVELMELARVRGIGPWLAERWLRVPPQIFAGASKRPQVFERLRAIVERHRWDELRSGAMAEVMNNGADPARALRAVTTALTVIIGDDDMPAFLRNAELIKRAVPGAERVRVAGAGHLPLVEEPEQCAPIVLRALGANA